MNILFMIAVLIIGFVLGLIFCKLYGRKRADYKIDFGGFNSSALISDRLTHILVQNYYEFLDAKNLLNASGTGGDEYGLEARLAWVSFSDLRKYMAFIEALSLKNGFTSLKGLGIRMYYGRYPDNVAEMSEFIKGPNVSQEFKGRHTLAFVPTYRDGDIDYDFSPNHIDNKSKKPKDLKEVYNKERVKPERQTGKGNNLPTVQSTFDDPNEIDVNLNSFGLTPPRPGQNAGISHFYDEPTNTTTP